MWYSVFIWNPLPICFLLEQHGRKNMGSNKAVTHEQGEKGTEGNEKGTGGRWKPSCWRIGPGQGRKWRQVFLGKSRSSLICHPGFMGHLPCARPGAPPGAGERQWALNGTDRRVRDSGKHTGQWPLDDGSGSQEGTPQGVLGTCNWEMLFTWQVMEDRPERQFLLRKLGCPWRVAGWKEAGGQGSGAWSAPGPDPRGNGKRKWTSPTVSRMRTQQWLATDGTRPAPPSVSHGPWEEGSLCARLTFAFLHLEWSQRRLSVWFYNLPYDPLFQPCRYS